MQKSSFFIQSSSFLTQNSSLLMRTSRSPSCTRPARPRRPRPALPRGSRPRRAPRSLQPHLRKHPCKSHCGGLLVRTGGLGGAGEGAGLRRADPLCRARSGVAAVPRPRLARPEEVAAVPRLLRPQRIINQRPSGYGLSCCCCLSLSLVDHPPVLVPRLRVPLEVAQGIRERHPRLRVRRGERQACLVNRDSVGLQKSAFLIQNSSFLIHSSLFLIQNSLFLIQNSLFLLTHRLALFRRPPK